MSEKSAENFGVVVDGGRYTAVNRGMDAFSDRMVADSKSIAEWRVKNGIS